jgi:hypothetical protein
MHSVLPVTDVSKIVGILGNLAFLILPNVFSISQAFKRSGKYNVCITAYMDRHRGRMGEATLTKNLSGAAHKNFKDHF